MTAMIYFSQDDRQKFTRAGRTAESSNPISSFKKKVEMARRYKATLQNLEPTVSSLILCSSFNNVSQLHLGAAEGGGSAWVVS